MDGIVHGVAKGRTRLSDFHFHRLEPLVVQHLKGTASQILKKKKIYTGVKLMCNAVLGSAEWSVVGIIDFIWLPGSLRLGGG